MNRLWAEETMKHILKKLENTAPNIGASFPHVSKTGTYNDEPFSWVSGFWPGILWLAYQQTGKAEYAQYAAEIETKLDIILDGFDMVEHDTGFMWQLSAGANYRLTGNEDSRRRCMKAASFLASRFHLKGNYIQAWNREPGWAIVDCTMNLAQLYWASKEIDNPRFAQIADAHAQTVLEYIVRPDGSTNHIVSFEPESGEYIGPLGGQGNAADSAWARGAAWAIYGLALCYHFTENPSYLDGAKRVCHFFTANLPEDYVAHWDFRVERLSDTPRDTSAAACAACGMLEIAKHVPECEKAFYENTAQRILQSLTKNYSNLQDDSRQELLRGGTGNFPAGVNINVGIIYGDYFYMEAISRLLGNDNIFWYENQKAKEIEKTGE